MSEWISYKGNALGRFKIGDHLKSIFVAKDLDSLEVLLGLKSSDEIEFESGRIISYEKFRESHLKNVSAFYSTMEQYLYKNYSAKELKELGLSDMLKE